MKQQTGARGEEEPQHLGALACALHETHLTRSSPKVVTPVLWPLWAAGDGDHRGQG